MAGKTEGQADTDERDDAEGDHQLQNAFSSLAQATLLRSLEGLGKQGAFDLFDEPVRQKNRCVTERTAFAATGQRTPQRTQ